MKIDKEWVIKVILFPVLAALLSAVADQMKDGSLTVQELVVAVQTALSLLLGVLIRRPGQPK